MYLFANIVKLLFFSFFFISTSINTRRNYQISSKTMCLSAVNCPYTV